MLEYTGGSPAAVQTPLSSLFKTIAILRIGTGTLLMTRHGFSAAMSAYQFFWKEQPWAWVTAFHEAGLPYPHLIAPLTALLVAGVALSWIIGFLTRLFSVLFLPVVITALVILQKAGSVQVEAAWLYLFITVTLLLYGSGAVSVDQLFRLGQGGSKKTPLMARVIRSNEPHAANSVERVLAIDPALRKTGWAVVECEKGQLKALAWGVIHNKPNLLPSGCLVAIREGLLDAIRQHAPTVCAIESTIFVQSFKTAIVLGTARGACLIAAAEHGLPIYEYAPREIKQAAVGRGAAQKEQVAFMIRAQLHLRETPPPDAADALATAITHFQNSAAARATERETRRV